MTEPVPVGRATLAAEKADRAWRVRIAGGSWDQAAQVAGYSDHTAAIRAVRQHYGTLPKLERDELRNLWRDRLEAAWRQCMVDMTEQKPGATTAAVRIAVAAANLDGLNAPLTVDVRATVAFERLVDELVAHDLA